MSAAWFGAFLAVGILYTVRTFFAVVMLGETVDIDASTVASNFVLAVLAILLANLVYLGVIL